MTATSRSVPSAAETWMLMSSLVMDYRGAWRDQVARETGLPFSRFRAVRRLEASPMAAVELAEVLGVDKSAASAIISDLEERGLVVRRGDPTDGRRRIVELTDSGQRIVDRLRSSPDGDVPLVGVLTERERSRLFELLSRMREGSR